MGISREQAREMELIVVVVVVVLVDVVAQRIEQELQGWRIDLGEWNTGPGLGCCLPFCD